MGKKGEIIGNISTGLDTIQQRAKRQDSYQQAMGYQTSKRVVGKIKSSWCLSYNSHCFKFLYLKKRQLTYDEVHSVWYVFSSNLEQCENKYFTRIEHLKKTYTYIL